MSRGRGAGPGRFPGFTLLEMLIVIVIISILASLTLVAVSMAMNSARHSNTEVLIDQLRGSLEQYKVRWGDFPPSTLAAFRTSLPNDTNSGAESLCACLSSREKGGALYQPSGEMYLNTDDDQAGRNITNWYFGDNQLREIRDYFGGPLAYFHFRDYAKPPPGVLRIVVARGQPAQTVKPHTSGETRTFVGADRFQILSAGRDGTFGTKDDIVK